LYDFNTQYSANKYLLDLFEQLLNYTGTKGSIDPSRAESLITKVMYEYMKTLESREYLKMIFSEFVTGISKFNIDNEFENYAYSRSKQTDISPSKKKTEFKVIKDYFQNDILPWENYHSGSIVSSRSEADVRRSVIVTKSDKKKHNVTMYDVSPEIFEEESSSPADRLDQIKTICIGFLKRLDQYIMFMPLTIRCFCKRISEYAKSNPSLNSRSIIAKLLLKIWMEPIANPIEYGIADICLLDSKYNKRVLLILNVIKRLLMGDKQINELNRYQLFINQLIEDNSYTHYKCFYR
jgi:GTPase-activator protein for Ras-like GTPase